MRFLFGTTWQRGLLAATCIAVGVVIILRWGFPQTVSQVAYWLSGWQTLIAGIFALLAGAFLLTGNRQQIEAARNARAEDQFQAARRAAKLIQYEIQYLCQPALAYKATSIRTLEKWKEAKAAGREIDDKSFDESMFPLTNRDFFRAHAPDLGWQTGDLMNDVITFYESCNRWPTLVLRRSSMEKSLEAMGDSASRMMCHGYMAAMRLEKFMNLEKTGDEYVSRTTKLTIEERLTCAEEAGHPKLEEYRAAAAAASKVNPENEVEPSPIPS